MKYAKTITLKDGRTCIIRNAEQKDAEKCLENFLMTHGQTDYLLTYPDESVHNVLAEEKYLVEKEISTAEVELCAVIDDQIIGTAGIEAVGHKDKVKHRADLGISIDENNWGIGIGRALLNACIACAKEAGYTQIELQAVAENERAVNLYKNAGFIEYGRNPKGFCTRQGRYQELILMRMDLQQSLCNAADGI